MPRRRTETTAASLLGAWTDCDTAMQVVGASLGVFDAGVLDPGTVLSSETPLRNALFDILLSLVEGGALEMRETDDDYYAFRWRADYAAAGLSPASATTIDLDVPSPYVRELAEMQREREDALGRAEFAEALAAERERLLRLANVPSPMSAARRPTREAREAVRSLDPSDQSVLDVLFSSGAAGDDARRPSPVTRPYADDPDVIDIREAEPEVGLDEGFDDEPEYDEPVLAEPERNDPDANDPDATTDTNDPDANDIVYLPPKSRAKKRPAPVPDTDDRDEDDANVRRPKWSGYTLDKSRSHLSSVDRLADEG